MVDVEVFDAAVVVAIADLELGRGRREAAELQRRRQVQEAVASFRKLGAARFQLMRDASGAPPLAVTTQQVTVLDADCRVAIVQAQHYRLRRNSKQQQSQQQQSKSLKKKKDQYPVDVIDGDGVPIAIGQRLRLFQDETGRVGAQGEGELQPAVHQFQGDEIVTLVVSSVVQQEAVPLSGGEAVDIDGPTRVFVCILLCQSKECSLVCCRFIT